MTDQLAALRLLMIYSEKHCREEADQALHMFYDQWKHEPLVVDQWFVTQALYPGKESLKRVKALCNHQAFDIKNPNKVRSLIGVFSSQNHVQFHQVGGDGYEFLADSIIQLDQINPQIAARMMTPLTRWKNSITRGRLLCRPSFSESKKRPIFQKMFLK